MSLGTMKQVFKRAPKKRVFADCCCFAVVEGTLMFICNYYSEQKVIFVKSCSVWDSQALEGMCKYS